MLSVAIDGANSVYLAGTSTSGEVDFGGPCSAVPALPFIVKMGSNGECAWGRGANADDASAISIAIAPDGSVVFAGNFQGSVGFGGPTLTTPGTSAYVVKLDGADGSFEWSTMFGGATDQEAAEATSVAVDGDGNLAVVGDFVGSLSFPTRMHASNDNITPDAFVVKLDPDGAYIWSKAISAPNIQFAFDVAIDPADNILVTGQYGGMVPNVLGSAFSLSTAGGGSDLDLFVLKLAP